MTTSWPSISVVGDTRWTTFGALISKTTSIGRSTGSVEKSDVFLQRLIHQNLLKNRCVDSIKQICTAHEHFSILFTCFNSQVLLWNHEIWPPFLYPNLWKAVKLECMLASFHTRATWSQNFGVSWLKFIPQTVTNLKKIELFSWCNFGSFNWFLQLDPEQFWAVLKQGPAFGLAPMGSSQ